MRVRQKKKLDNGGRPRPRAVDFSKKAYEVEPDLWASIWNLVEPRDRFYDQEFGPGSLVLSDCVVVRKQNHEA